MWRRVCHAVLFDLDGTLADTAPDLAAAINLMRRKRNLGVLPFEQIRPLIFQGDAGLIRLAFQIESGHRDFSVLREEFLNSYEAGVCVETKLFPGMLEIIEGLEARGVPWGIVTNKVERFTTPLVEALGLATRSACVVSGDTTAWQKPHPAPLLHAARALNVAPENIVYVGDDLRDIQAGLAAGMTTIAAGYGYCGTDVPPHRWGAHQCADTIDDLRQSLDNLIRSDHPG